MGTINTFSEQITTLQNTGYKQLVQNRLGVFRGMVIGVKGTLNFATATSALTLSDWETKFKAVKLLRAFPFPLFDAIEDKSTDDVYSESLQGQKFNEEGKLSFTAMVDVNKYLAINLRGFNGKDLEAVFVDESASLLGKTTDGVKFVGIPITLRVGTQKLAAKGEKMMLPITVTIKETSDWNDRGAVLEPMNETAFWNPLTDFDGVYDTTLTLTGASATGLTVAVTKNSIDTAVTTAGVSGLVKADFIHKRAGVVKAITSIAETAVSGTYTFVGSFANDDTIELVDCASITITTIKIEGTNIPAIRLRELTVE